VDYAGFLRAADAGAPPAVALLHGPEALLLDDAVRRVTRGLFPEGGDLTLSREILDSRDAGSDDAHKMRFACQKRNAFVSSSKSDVE